VLCSTGMAGLMRCQGRGGRVLRGRLIPGGTLNVRLAGHVVARLAVGTAA
jgi:hypothetical protein